jgi:hypothetical protein
MRTFVSTLAILLTLTLLATTATLRAQSAGADKKWSMNATIIEACSCPMFCQCYFDTKPAAHSGHGGHGGHGDASAAGGEHFCKFNNAFRVNSGSYGETRLDGAKFWVAGDLGGDFSQGKMDWAVVHFDPSVTKEQRDGIVAVLKHLYPVQWNSFTIGKDAPIEWSHTKDKAVARLDGGKMAEVVLKPFAGMKADEPVVMKNLKYWGAPRNEGFIMMPNEVQALRAVPDGKKAYEFKGTNGFMITFDIKSDDVK